MNARSGVERGVHQRNSPPPDMKQQPRFHCGVGNIAERVIEKMREDIREQDKTAGEPHLSNADATQSAAHARQEADAVRAYIDDRRPDLRHAQPTFRRRSRRRFQKTAGLRPMALRFGTIIYQSPATAGNARQAGHRTANTRHWGDRCGPDSLDVRLSASVLAEQPHGAGLRTFLSVLLVEGNAGAAP